MRFRLCAASLIFTVYAFAAAPPPPKSIAPATIPHPMAMFLGELSKDGKEKVTFRASALGTHFFFEEAAGVTVYVYDASVGYRKETFLKGATLAKALKQYP
jgi:hypothetical protein